MRKSNDQPLREVIDQLLQTYRLKKKFNEHSIIMEWPEIIGKPVARHTREIFIRESKLFLRIDSAVVKHQIMMMRQEIIEAINTKAETELVKEVVLL